MLQVNIGAKRYSHIEVGRWKMSKLKDLMVGCGLAVVTSGRLVRFCLFSICEHAGCCQTVNRYDNDKSGQHNAITGFS